MFLDFLFALDEVKVFLVPTDENLVPKGDFVVLFVQFVKVVHIELNFNKIWNLPYKRRKVAVSKVLREDKRFHLLNVEYNHFFTVLVPIYGIWVFLYFISITTWIMSQSLQMNYVSDCFLVPCSDIMMFWCLVKIIIEFKILARN